MVFNSPTYIFFFFPLIFLVALLLKARSLKYWLCVSLCLFYAFGDLRSLPLLLLFALLQYALGFAVRGRKTVFTLAVCLDVFLLCACKYTGFMPLGVSFFSFQGIAYLVEVYRTPEKATKDFAELLLYLCFFPRLLAGPLMGWDEHHRQYASLRMSASDTADGLRRFVKGLGKKLLLSDIAALVANDVFAADAASVSTVGAWLGAIAYCLQLYFDFSGYSDMAIGMGMVFGFRFPENFDYPFLARSISDFWRRWHITLGSWFREYVYIPLGGSRKGRLRTALNKFIVFLLTGLWHGFGWTYVLWGLWHGLFSALESLVKVDRRISRFYTLPAVVLGFVMFRAVSVQQGLTLLTRLFSFSGGFTPALNGVRLFALCAGAPLSVLRLPERVKNAVPRLVSDALLLFMFLFCLCVMAGNSFAPFIYAQF